MIGVITTQTASVQEAYAAEEKYLHECRCMTSIENIAQIIFSLQDDETITREELEEVLTHRVYGRKIATLVQEVSLPMGFTMADCHGMFDRDASGSITREEFVDGMGRLIFSNEFQRSCIVQSSISDVLIEVKA